MATLGRTGDVEMAVGELHQRQAEQRAQEERTSPGSPMAAPNSPEEKLEKLVRASFTARNCQRSQEVFCLCRICGDFSAVSLFFFTVPTHEAKFQPTSHRYVFMFEAMWCLNPREMAVVSSMSLSSLQLWRCNQIHQSTPNKPKDGQGWSFSRGKLRVNYKFLEAHGGHPSRSTAVSAEEE